MRHAQAAWLRPGGRQPWWAGRATAERPRLPWVTQVDSLQRWAAKKCGGPAVKPLAGQPAKCVVVIWAEIGAQSTNLHTRLSSGLHYARDAYLMGKFKIKLVGTNKMMGDNMTKPLDKAKFLACRAYQMNE